MERITEEENNRSYKITEWKTKYTFGFLTVRLFLSNINVDVYIKYVNMSFQKLVPFFRYLWNKYGTNMSTLENNPYRNLNIFISSNAS